MNTNDLEQLAAKEAAAVRREAREATRQLAKSLIRSYDWLTTDEERRRFYEKHQDTLKHTGGLLGICLESCKPLSFRARREFEAIPDDGTLRRCVFERLTPRTQMAFIQAGGRLTDK